MLSYVQSLWYSPKTVQGYTNHLPEKTPPKNPEAIATLELLMMGEPDTQEETEKYFSYSSTIYQFLSECRLDLYEHTVYLKGREQPLILSNDGDSTTLELDGEELVLMDTSFEQLLGMFKSNIANMPATFSNSICDETTQCHVANFEVADAEFKPLDYDELDKKLHVNHLNKPGFDCQLFEYDGARNFHVLSHYAVLDGNLITKKIYVSNTIQGAEINEFISDNLDNQFPIFAPYVEKRWDEGKSMSDHIVLLAIVNQHAYILDSKSGLSEYQDIEKGIKSEITILPLYQQFLDDPYSTHYVFENLNQILDWYGKEGDFARTGTFKFLRIIPKEIFSPQLVHQKIIQLSEVS